SVLYRERLSKSSASSSKRRWARRSDISIERRRASSALRQNLALVCSPKSRALRRVSSLASTAILNCEAVVLRRVSSRLASSLNLCGICTLSAQFVQSLSQNVRDVFLFPLTLHELGHSSSFGLNLTFFYFFNSLSVCCHAKSTISERR